MRSIAVLFCAVVLNLGACSRPPALPPPDSIYTVRGRVVQLPEPGKPASSLQIHHEPIDSYVRADGRLGMNAMTMPFTPAPGLTLEGIAVGDVVEFRWEVRKGNRGGSFVTALAKLPADTPLNLGKAKPPG